MRFSAVVGLILSASAIPALSNEIYVSVDEVSSPLPPPPPLAGSSTHSCDDGSSFTCLSNSTHCVPNSAVYCKFSVELVKEMSA